MSSFLNVFWIISKDGAPLVEIFNNTKIDPNLFAALLSAIETFSIELGEGVISSVVVGNKRLIISPCLDGNVFLVSETDANVKEKKIKKIFKVLAGYFEELYTIEVIQNWDGDLSFFDKFKDRIDIYFQMYDL